MKFEQVLKMYWSKGFFFNGKVIPFHSTTTSLTYNINGINLSTIQTFIKRFELNLLFYKRTLNWPTDDRRLQKYMNILLSQLSSVNNQIIDLKRFSLIRLYLIKTTRGKAQALGQPSRGQRTWSNAWTAYSYNKVIRTFIATIQKNLKQNLKEEQINFKILKKKTRKPKSKKINVKIKSKSNTWF